MRLVTVAIVISVVFAFAALVFGLLALRQRQSYDVLPYQGNETTFAVAATDGTGVMSADLTIAAYAHQVPKSWMRTVNLTGIPDATATATVLITSVSDRRAVQVVTEPFLINTSSTGVGPFCMLFTDIGLSSIDDMPIRYLPGYAVSVGTYWAIAGGRLTRGHIHLNADRLCIRGVATSEFNAYMYIADGTFPMAYYGNEMFEVVSCFIEWQIETPASEQ